jgi:hypothetical protein
MGPSTIALLLFGAAGAAFLAVKFGGAWLKYRGARVVTCPESQAPAGVRVDATHAAATAFHPELRLKECSRWPERRNCGQECLRQIEAAPDDCLVRNLFAQWYHGRQCVICKEPFGEIQWAEQKPGLLLAQDKLADWSELKTEDVPATLQTAKPVCFRCYVATRMAREHPDMVVDRGRASA